MEGFRAHVNLIPYNPIAASVSGVVYRRPDAGRVWRFLQLLHAAGVVAHVRRPRGDDVSAACGQLAGKYNVAVASANAGQAPPLNVNRNARLCAAFAGRKRYAVVLHFIPWEAISCFTELNWCARNWHVVLVHFPIGLLGMGLAIEILGFLWRRSSVRAAARWMILLGTLGCMTALTSGLYAFRQALSGNDEADWSEDPAQ